MSAPTLAERIEALAVAARAVEAFTSVEAQSAVREVDVRASQRASVGLEQTVVALAGSTGSGKSSLFNAITGLELAEVGVLRPTTAAPLACWWGDRAPVDLLDWLGVPEHLRVARRSSLDDTASLLDGLVLLDLPDHDSMELSHREKVDRLVGLVDMVVWVVDPVKYADALLHEQYLSAMSRHGAVVVVVLNQADLLTRTEQDACTSHLRDLLAGDGLPDLDVLVTSAALGTGVDELTRRIADSVARRGAAAERLAADVAVIAARLRAEAGLPPARPGLHETSDPMDRPEVDAMVATDELRAVLVGHRTQFAAEELAWPWSKTAGPRPVDEPDLDRDELTARLEEYVDGSTDVLTPMWRHAERESLRPVPAQLVEGWCQEVRHVVETAPQPRPAWEGVRRAQRLVLALAATAIALGVVGGILLAEDSNAYLPLSVAALVAATAAAAGGLLVHRRRRSERDGYAAAEADELIEGVRVRVRRDVRVQLELPLEQARRDHDAAVAALALAEA